jgi:hypothetical protein
MGAHQVQVVGGHQDGHPHRVDLSEELEDALGRPLVQVPRRLVGQQEQRLVHQRARDGHPLPLAAGELVRIGARLVRQPHLREHAVGARRDGGALGSRHLQREGDVLLGGAVAQEAEVLEDDAHLAAQHGDVALADELGREAGDAHLAPGGCLGHLDEAEDGALPGAGVPGEEDQLAFVDVERHVPERHAGAGILLGYGREPDHAFSSGDCWEGCACRA